LRIISGKNKGRKIIAPAHLPVRPTTDFAKEGLFDILTNHFVFSETDILDLFAGTGNISYEFISRDAKSVIAVDNNYGCIKFIQQTSEKLNYKNLNAIRADYKVFIKHTGKKWDIIFADPPYDMEDIENLPALIFEKQLLKPNGWLIIEHGKNTDLRKYPDFFDHRVYGHVNFSFFTKN
jgi:16S rRNA (guanine(966)-N(2))-methyltransferase RsmD